MIKGFTQKMWVQDLRLFPPKNAIELDPPTHSKWLFKPTSFFCRNMKFVLILKKQQETLALRKKILCQLCFSLEFQLWNGYWSRTLLGEEYQFKITSHISVSLCLAPSGFTLRAWFFGWFWGPQISWHKDPGWLSECFPGSKSHLSYSVPIFCDFYISIASSLQI